MAEAPKLVTDAEGTIIEGKFKGRHINEVMDYLEHLESAISEDEAPPARPAAAPPTAKPKTPAETLAARSADRITGFEQLTQATAARAVQDDEDAFAATVRDYDSTIPGMTKSTRAMIADLKAKTPLAQQMTKGWHRQAYMLLKQQDPKVQARILASTDDDVDDGAPPPQEDSDPAEIPPDQAPSAPAPVAKPKPKPVPVVRPTAAARTPSAKAAAKPSTLQDSDGKLARVAAAMGKSLPAYLASLEERGVTQDQINAQSFARAGGPRRRTVYDNV